MPIEQRNCDIERRELDCALEVRRLDGPKPGTLSGYGLLWLELSEDLGGFREQFSASSMHSILNGADVRIFYSHDPSKVLGRTRSGTAQVAADTKGLHFTVDLPDTVVARDLMESIERNDISGASVGFIVGDDEWSTDEAGFPVRTITRVEKLIEVSIVALPAYPSSSIAVQRMQEYKSSENAAIRAEAESRERTLHLINNRITPLGA